MKASRFVPAAFAITLLAGACAAPSVAPAAPPAQAPAAEQAPVAGAASGEKVKITHWFNITDGGEMANCIIDNIVKPFNAQNASIEVEAVTMANVWDASKTAIAGGAGPDLFDTPGPSYALAFARAGQLVPLDEYAKKYGWGERFAPWALNLGMVDGKLYSLSTEVETVVLYYNKTLFEQKGWTPPKTLDELAALAEAAQKEGIIPFASGNAEWKGVNEWLVGEWFNRIAGPQKVYDALTGKAKWTDPEFVKAVEMLTDMQRKGYFMGGLEKYYTATSDEFHSAFGSGKAAMNIEGTWFLPFIDNFFGEKANNTNDWGWVPMPSQDGKPLFNMAVGSTYSINKNTKNPDAVAEYLNYLFLPETQASYLTKCGLAPAAVKLDAASLQGLDPRRIEVLETLDRAAREGGYGYTTWTFWPAKTNTYLIEEIEKVWSGAITAQQYLEGMQKLFDEEVKAGAIPPIPVR